MLIWLHPFFYLTFIIVLFNKILPSYAMIKSATLTPGNTISNGAVLITDIPNVTELDNTWIAYITEERRWPFILSLDDSWGFGSNTYSSIQITIDSPSLTTDSPTFDSLVLTFATNNAQYISTLIAMNVTAPNQIYPGCNIKSTQPFATGDITNIDSIPQFDDWKNMLPINIPHELHKMPVTFQLENNPTLQTLTLSYHYGTDIVQQCLFTTLSAMTGLKVYIAGNDIGQSFKVVSFQIGAISSELNAVDIPSTSLPTNDKITYEDTDSGYLYQQDTDEVTEYQRTMIPIILVSFCIILSVVIRIGCQGKGQKIEPSPISFQKVASYSIVYSYIVRVHFLERLYIYCMHEEREKSGETKGCNQWMKYKYDQLLDAIAYEFELQRVPFRLYEVVDGEEEDINSIDDIVVAFDSVLNGEHQRCIDIYVELIEDDVTTYIRKNKEGTIATLRPRNSFKVSVCRLKPKSCMRMDSSISETDGDSVEEINRYLKHKFIELMEATASERSTNKSSTDTVLSYYE